MADYVFQKIIKRGEKKGFSPLESRQAIEWYRNTAKKTRVSSESFINRAENERLRKRPTIGRMYSFLYDPKTKDTLPYYDKFPLIFMIGPAPKGFMGINLHYLPPILRAQLMNSLYDLLNNNKYDETTKLRISYDVLSKASKYRFFKPCVKRYLTNHVRSRLIMIYPEEWDIALMLPTQKFVGASSNKVWGDSRNAI